MKLMLLFTTLNLVSCWASIYSQNVTLDLHDTRFGDVIEEISRQTNLDFAYSKEIVDLDRHVTISVENNDLKSVMDVLLKGTQLLHLELNGKIYIGPNEIENILKKTVLQQQLTIKGNITDLNNIPLPGVNIVVKGTTVGAVSDLDGNYSINIPSGSTTLIFSYVGYLTEEINVDNQTTINVTLIEDIQSLEEVVVVGYGTQKRVNLTGSVATASADRLASRPIQSVGQGLQGVIPNLNVTLNNGDPTSTTDFNIRGFESINGGSPLILVDGVPMSMDKLNPNDIESISVLKDAAAAAIYGARAAFGVILVETKKGKKGERVHVSLSTEQSVGIPISLIDPITDPLEAAEAWNTAYQRTYGYDRYDQVYMEGFARYKENPTLENQYEVVDGVLRNYGYIDYKDRTVADYSPQKKYDLSVSGGSEKASYYFSLGHLSKDGWIAVDDKNIKYKRYNLLAKTDFEINEWLSLDEQITLNAENNDKPHSYNWDVNINSIARREPHAMIEFPDLPYYIEPGDREQFEPYIGKYFSSVNFLPYLEDGGRDSDVRYDLTLKQGITLKPFEGFKIRGDFAYNIYHRNVQEVQSEVEMLVDADLTNLTYTNGYSGTDYIRNLGYYNQGYVFNTYAEYEMNELDNHYIKAMVGFNQEWNHYSYTLAKAYDLITPEITDLNATTGGQETGGSKAHVALRGLFYRFNYIYKDKYLLETNGRYDGTSRFPKDDRFGFFPSISLGWRISEESFMEATSSWLDNLKLRASYGELGNQLLSSRYPYISSMSSGTSVWLMNDSKTPYILASNLVSPTLTWETVSTKNVGIDITTLNQRLDVSFDAYIRDTEGMLMGVEYPEILGTDAPETNAADLRTRGWELAINWHDRIGSDWSYSINFALSDNQSEITKYDNPTGSLDEYYVGQKIGEIWGYETEGIFQTEDEITNHADQSYVGPNWEPGDIKYKDLNGDGVIDIGNNTIEDPGDYKVIANTTARYSFGINTDVQYKNWGLNVFFQGLFRDYLPGNANLNAFYPFNSGVVESWYIDESWSEDNRGAYFPAPYIGTSDKKNIVPQSRWVQNASYLRLKNVMLSYTLPSDLIQKIKLSNARVYISGMNLLTFSGIHKPLDPEQVSTVTQEYYFYKTLSVGLNVTF